MARRRQPDAVERTLHPRAQNGDLHISACSPPGAHHIGASWQLGIQCQPERNLSAFEPQFHGGMYVARGVEPHRDHGARCPVEHPPYLMAVKASTFSNGLAFVTPSWA